MLLSLLHSSLTLASFPFDLGRASHHTGACLSFFLLPPADLTEKQKKLITLNTLIIDFFSRNRDREEHSEAKRNSGREGQEARERVIFFRRFFSPTLSSCLALGKKKRVRRNSLSPNKSTATNRHLPIFIYCFVFVVVDFVSVFFFNLSLSSLSKKVRTQGNNNSQKRLCSFCVRGG